MNLHAKRRTSPRERQQSTQPELMKTLVTSEHKKQTQGKNQMEKSTHIGASPIETIAPLMWTKNDRLQANNSAQSSLNRFWWFAVI
jgi:hypothetical protein